MFPVSSPNQILDAHHYVIASQPEHYHGAMIISPIHGQTEAESRMNADTIAHRIQGAYPKASVIITNFKPTRNIIAQMPYRTYTCDHPEDYFPR